MYEKILVGSNLFRSAYLLHLIQDEKKEDENKNENIIYSSNHFMFKKKGEDGNENINYLLFN